MPAASDHRILANKITEGIKEMAQSRDVDRQEISHIFEVEFAKVSNQIKEKILGSAEIIRHESPAGTKDRLDKISIVRPEFKPVLQAVQARRPVLLYGPTGSGKTSLVRQIAKVMNARMGSITLTEGMDSGPLLGWIFPQDDGRWRYQPSELAQIVKDGGIYLFDEIDAADPNTLLSVNNLLALGFMDTPLNAKEPRIQAHENFIPIAAANTIGSGSDASYNARKSLDLSTRDRFCASTFYIGYSEAIEEGLVGENKAFLVKCWAIRRKIEKYGLRRAMSTRFIADAMVRMANGATEEDLWKSYFQGWADDEKQKVR